MSYIVLLNNSKMQIVNVDDDQDDRDMFCMAIKRIDPDIQCMEISSAEDAIDFLSNGEISPDYIFMDINMPRMNGYECVQEIYQYSNLKNTTIIMHSSTFNPRDQIDFGVLGLKYLQKTSSLPSLVESITKLIQPGLLEGKQKT
jgi:CheY-like chemotaxis protein